MFLLRDSSNEIYPIAYESINRFPDGTLAFGCIPKNITSILWNYDYDDELFILMCLRDHSVQKDVTLYLPYIPNARMDRVKNNELFTLKTFCKAINLMNFSKVVVVDPHSNVSSALLDRVVVITPELYIKEALSIIEKENNTDNIALFFPDEGAMKRYSTFNFGCPFSFGMKEREWETGKIKGFTIFNKEAVKDKIVLIVDDLCSKGGTFYHSVKALKEVGAKDIYLYVTHCEDTIFRGQLYEERMVKRVFTTDSISRELNTNWIYFIHNFKQNFISNGFI